MAHPDRITTTDALDAALTASAERTLVLFKHSTRCPISTRAHDEFLSYTGSLADDTAVDTAIVYVVEERPVSNAVAERFAIRHESPQAFVIKDGTVSWHASHDDITRESLTAAVAAGVE